MDIFIIHAGKEEDIVEERNALLKGKAYDANLLMLKNGGKLWKLGARAKIKAAQAVVIFLSAKSAASDNVGWEIEESKRQGKIIYSIELYKDAPRHPNLDVEHQFLDEKTPYDKKVTIDELADIINSFENGEYQLFNTDFTDDTATMLEQYKIFLATSEAVVDRRQSTNNFYITVNSALLAFYGVIAALDVEIYIKAIMGAIFSVVGMILCISWMRIITSYGNLNGSKMTIINLIEKKLPLSLYAAEWAALSDKLNKKRYVPFSSAEKSTPRLFCAIYTVLFFMLAALFVIGIVK